MRPGTSDRLAACRHNARRLDRRRAIGRGSAQLVDLAGLDARDATEPEQFDAAAQIEKSMQQRAARSIESADYVLFVRETFDPHPPVSLVREPDLVVFTKADLDGSSVTTTLSGVDRRPVDTSQPASRSRCVLVRLFTGQGMSALRDALDELCFGRREDRTTFALNARHIGLIESAIASLRRSLNQSHDEFAELLALELREALDALGQVIGLVTPDDVLGKIFASFCIGK